jgi:predicted thioesterase
MLKEAGLMDDAELANQIVDSEKKIEAVKQVLREVSSTCPRCKVMVAERLSEIDGRAVPIKIIVEEPSGSN